MTSRSATAVWQEAGNWCSGIDLFVYMMNRVAIVVSAVLLCCGLTGCNEKKVDLSSLDYCALKEQAMKEILRPVHPGAKGGVPFWNKYSFRFIYAPAFDFDEVEGAGSYVFTATSGDVSKSFSADTPAAPLSPVWNDIPYGLVHLGVQAVDKDNKPVGEPQTREFTKSQPFSGPYEEPKTGYLEAAVKAAEWIHRSQIGSLWFESAEPNLKYPFNAYPCKIWSAIIQCECFLAKNKPELRDSALTVARNVAEALLENSLPEGDPLAYFPPTYYTKKIDKDGLVNAILERFGDYTMMVEAVCAAEALLDLYDITGERKYFDHACHIAETYRTLQSEDGCWPVKVNYHTGEPVSDAPCMPTTILHLAGRLKDQYKVKGFEDMVEKGEAWLWANTISTFNFNGQFEDTGVADKARFQNLTNCTAVDCVDYLLGKAGPSKEEIDAAVEITRFAEDQFTYWSERLDHERVQDVTVGIHEMIPFVFEQYVFRYPVDHSAAGVAMAFMRVYEATGDTLALVKAKALADAIIRSQYPSGYIDTCMLQHDPDLDVTDGSPWTNCTFRSITALSRMAEIAE